MKVGDYVLISSVRDSRGYRVEEWSDFTPIVKN